MARPRRCLLKRVVLGGLAVLMAWLVLAYEVLPAAWTHYEHQPALAGRAMATRTADHIPGDPLNIGLVGDRTDLVRAMQAAGWSPADPVTLRSSLAIVGSVVLNRPDIDAPVSALFYDDRREDLAFELPVGDSARRRHHVRLWQVLSSGAEQRPVWLGSATFDQGVGLSHDTGQVTHHIAPDIDAERDGLAGDLQAAGVVATAYQVTGVGPTLVGRNGGGDLYRTDGEVHVLVLRAGEAGQATAPVVLRAPWLVRVKDGVFTAVRRVIGP